MTQPRTSSTMALLISGFAAFGGFLYGYDTGYISGVKETPYWVNKFGTLDSTGTMVLTSGRDSLVTSILSAGTFCGALLSYPAGDLLGRRYGILAFLVLFVIGVALQTGAPGIATFVVGRVFAGLGVGGTSCLVPMFQSEVAPKHIRGAVVGGYQWAITWGLLLSGIVVWKTHDHDSMSSYAIPIGLQFVWALVLGVGLCFLPESPRWLVAVGRDVDAQRSIARILSVPQDSDAVAELYAEIAAAVHHTRSLGGTTYLDCFKNTNRNRLRSLTGIGLQAIQQLTGINFIFYYGTTFFNNAGLTNSFVITIATQTVNVGMTVPGLWGIERYGRRSMLLVGAIGMSVCHIIVGAVGDAVSTDNKAGQNCLVAFVCIFVSFFAATWGPMPWVVTGEIYPTATRAKQMSMSTASNWLLNFGIGYATPYLVDTGPGNAGLQTNVFWIWGGACLVAIVFVYFFIPETRGLSLEQIDILYRNSSIRTSNSYRRKILEENIQDEDKEIYLQNKTEAQATTSHNENVEKRDLEESA